MINAETESGLMGMSSDYTSPSRFVKAATLLKCSDKSKSFHLMNAANTLVVKISTEETSGNKKEDKKNKKNKKDRAEEDEEEGSFMAMKSRQQGCLYIKIQDLR